MNIKTIENFTAKIAKDIKDFGVKHDPKTYILDPGKFGRVASGQDSAKYVVCRILNAYIKSTGTIDQMAVEQAFRQAGL